MKEKSMLNKIKQHLPHFLFVWRHKYRYRNFKNKTTEEAFTEIYNKNYWRSKESISGNGSELSQTRKLIQDLEKVLKDYHIKTILDLPCGDFNWMQHVNLNGVKYLGGDIVEDLIKKNKAKYTKEGEIEFQVLNLMKDPLPKSDLVFVRDCLTHLSFNDIHQSIENIKKSQCKYLLTNTYPDVSENKDIVTGDSRTLNMLLPPFNFPKTIVDY